MLEIQRKEANQEKWRLSQIWNTKWTRHLLIIGVILGLADQVTGINTAMYYTPKVLAAAGFPMTDAISLNVISGGISFIGSAVGLWLVTRFARANTVTTSGTPQVRPHCSRCTRWGPISSPTRCMPAVCVSMGWRR